MTPQCPRLSDSSASNPNGEKALQVYRSLQRSRSVPSLWPSAGFSSNPPNPGATWRESPPQAELPPRSTPRACPGSPAALAGPASRPHLKDLASAQSVHVRGHEEKDPLSGESWLRAAPRTPAPPAPTVARPRPFPQSRSPGRAHLALDHLVELLAEVGHEHDRGTWTPRDGTRPAWQPSRLPPSPGSPDCPGGQPIATQVPASPLF